MSSQRLPRCLVFLGPANIQVSYIFSRVLLQVEIGAGAELIKMAERAADCQQESQQHWGLHQSCTTRCARYTSADRAARGIMAVTFCPCAAADSAQRNWTQAY